METKLARITEIAKTQPKVRFTSLAHLINETMLQKCHQTMAAGKAPGMDRTTKMEYGKELATNIRELVERMKRQAYKPQPVKRVYIPKPGSKEKRPLGIPNYEDKLIQAALTKILNAIYEADFLECSYGFRPGRSVHDALRKLGRIVEQRNINYIVEVDIKKFFDHVNHEWLMKLIAHRIADPNIQRLIARFLKAGIMEAGKRYETTEGTPQGGVGSPVLANVYLHYVLDLWFEKAVKPWCKGEAYLIRYADDFVCCFQHETEAKVFYKALIQRLAKFNLTISEEKTRIIAFGKRPTEGKDEGHKPDTFDFLGITHYCGKDHQGRFRVKRKTSRKKYQASLKRCKEWLKINRHMPFKQLMCELSIKLTGYYRHYGITWNSRMLKKFDYEVKRLLFKWLNRRSQRKSFGWDKFELTLAKFPLPKPKIYISMYSL